MNLSHTLPDFSCMMKVGQLRHIQSTRESGAFWNPDTLVWQFLSPAQRWSCLWRGRLLLQRLQRLQLLQAPRSCPPLPRTCPGRPQRAGLRTGGPGRP